MSTSRTVICLLVLLGTQTDTLAQQPPVRRLDRDLETERNRISRERTSRQTEVARLERMVERLQERVVQLERRLFGSTQFPAITVNEAEAVLRFAKKRLDEDESLLEEGRLAESQVEADRLAVIRAKAQLSIAQAARRERSVILDIERIDAEKTVAEENRKLDQLRSLLAKGFGTTSNLELQKLVVARAEKELQRVKIRAAVHEETGPPERSSDGPPEASP